MNAELVIEIMNEILAKNAGNHNTPVTIVYANCLEITEPHINIQPDIAYVYITNHQTYDKYITYESINAIHAKRM